MQIEEMKEIEIKTSEFKKALEEYDCIKLELEKVMKKLTQKEAECQKLCLENTVLESGLKVGDRVAWSNYSNVLTGKVLGFSLKGKEMAALVNIEDLDMKDKLVSIKKLKKL